MTDNNNNDTNATAITTPNNEHTSPPSPTQPSPTQPSLDDDEEILLAKRMFLAGLLGLPWLWLCNVLYFRKRVFGPMRFVDYWPGGANDSTATATATDSTGNENGTTNPATSLTMQQQLHQQLQFQHLQKWVHRSTFSALLVISVFVAWIIGFQVNKDAFSDKWFVVTVDEGEATGW